MTGFLQILVILHKIRQNFYLRIHTFCVLSHFPAFPVFCGNIFFISDRTAGSLLCRPLLDHCLLLPFPGKTKNPAIACRIFPYSFLRIFFGSFSPVLRSVNPLLKYHPCGCIISVNLYFSGRQHKAFADPENDLPRGGTMSHMYLKSTGAERPG